MYACILYIKFAFLNSFCGKKNAQANEKLNNLKGFPLTLVFELVIYISSSLYCALSLFFDYFIFIETIIYYL